MKKLLSISLSILLVIALFVPVTLVPVSAETTSSDVIYIENELFGNFCSTTLPGPNADDTTSLVFNGSATVDVAKSVKVTGLENGVYVFSFDIMTSGDINPDDGLSPRANVGTNTGTTAATEIVVNAFNYTNGWNKDVKTMLNVTDGYAYVGLIWMAKSDAHVYTDETTSTTKNTWIRLDNLKLQKVDVLDHTVTGGTNTDKTYVTDTSIADDRANGTTRLLTGRYSLEPFTTYTMYIPVSNTGVQGSFCVFSYNNDATAFSEAAGGYLAKKSVNTYDTTGAWNVKELTFTTGLSGVIWIKMWLENTAITEYTPKLRISGLSVIKQKDNPYGFVPHTYFQDSNSTEVEGGYITDTQIDVTIAETATGKWFAPYMNNLDNGMYMFSAYVKVTEDMDNVEWIGVDGTNTEVKRYTVLYDLKKDAGWQYVSAQFYVTSGSAKLAFWVSGHAGATLSFDGVKLEKLTEISVEDTYKYWKSNGNKRFPNGDSEIRVAATIAKASSSVQGYLKDADGNTMYLEPNTDYIAYMTYKMDPGTDGNGAGGDWTVSTYDTDSPAAWDSATDRKSANKAFFTVKDGSWATSQIRFTTGDSGLVNIFIYFRYDLTEICFDGISFVKAGPSVENIISEPDIDVAGSKIATNAVTGIVETQTIAALKRGDATGDGNVNILDIIRLKKYLADKENTEVSEKACYVTGGEEITVNDVTGLKKILMGIEL